LKEADQKYPIIVCVPDALAISRFSKSQVICNRACPGYPQAVLSLPHGKNDGLQTHCRHDAYVAHIQEDWRRKTTILDLSTTSQIRINRTCQTNNKS
jgi:hypothetical protein